MSPSIPGQHHTTPPRHRDEPDDDREPRDVGQLAAFTRVPPQNLDAEQSVIGALLLSGSPGSASYRFFAETLETGIRAEEYYRPAHETIHRAICDLRAAGEPVDPVTVAAKLTERGELTRVGGPAYLHACVQAVPTPASTPAVDRCPVTGRGRLSYRRAAELFTAATRPLDPAGRGWTLLVLRDRAPRNRTVPR